MLKICRCRYLKMFLPLGQLIVARLAQLDKRRPTEREAVDSKPARTSTKGQVIRATFSLNLSRNIVALQVEKRCCPYYHLRSQLVTQQISMLQVAATVFPRINAAAFIKFFMIWVRRLFEGGVYSRAAFINILALRCGVYLRAAFIRGRRLFEEIR